MRQNIKQNVLVIGLSLIILLNIVSVMISMFYSSNFELKGVIIALFILFYCCIVPCLKKRSLLKILSYSSYIILIYRCSFYFNSTLLMFITIIANIITNLLLWIISLYFEISQQKQEIHLLIHPQTSMNHQINKITNIVNGNGSETCTICYERMIENVIETKCNHRFHKDCFTSWFEIKNNCPLCRKEYFINVVVQ